MADKMTTLNDDIDLAAARVADHFYIMYPQAKSSMPKGAKQSLRQYIAREVRKMLQDRGVTDA